MSKVVYMGEGRCERTVVGEQHCLYGGDIFWCTQLLPWPFISIYCFDRCTEDIRTNIADIIIYC